MTYAQLLEYLGNTPLLGLVLTLCSYLGGQWLFVRLRRNPLANPVLIAIACIVLFLSVSGISYERYFIGGQFIHFLLGPATVALALPLYCQIRSVRALLVPIVWVLPLGALLAPLVAMLLCQWLGGSESVLLSMLPKSVTTPIAMGISERVGGIPSLTAVFVLLTGVTGAMCAGCVFRVLRIHRAPARGFALGTIAHGVGTSRALQDSEQAGAFSALAMGLNGVLSAVLLPLALPVMQKILDWLG